MSTNAYSFIITGQESVSIEAQNIQVAGLRISSRSETIAIKTGRFKAENSIAIAMHPKIKGGWEAPITIDIWQCI